MVLAVAAYAKAEAEADPAFVYSTAGVLPYAYAHHPLVYNYAPLLAAGCRNVAGALVPCAHGALVAPVVAAPAAAAEEPAVSVEKREAEAEAEPEATADPEADPWLYYGGYYGYAHHPYAYSYAPWTYSHVYRHYGLPYHYGYYGKREAEAEPEAEAKADADPYLLYGYHPYAYGYHPYTYGYGWPAYGYYYGK